jgi:hypothetical protein
MNESIEVAPKRKPHRLDKYLDYLTAGENVKMSPSQLERFDLMSRVHTWRCNFWSPQQCVKILMEKHGERQSNAYAIMQDSDYIFGKMTKMNSEAEKGIIYELLHHAAQLIKNDASASGIEKGLALERITEKMGKIARVYDDGIKIDPTKLIPAINVMITTEPRPEPINIDAEIIQE